MTRIPFAVSSALLLFPSCALCPGCGLVVWPYHAHFPGPVQRVRVEDARTGTPITDAGVNFRILPCDYSESGTAKTSDRWPVVDAGGPRGTSENVRLNDDPAALAYEPVNSTGEVQIPPMSRWGLAQYWWPLPLTYTGWIQFHGSENAIVASAPGFRPRIVWFTPGAHFLRDLPVSDDGILVIRLDRE